MSSLLTALSPLDGRYASKTKPLQEHFSEFALIRERVSIEVAWLLALAADPGFTPLKPFSPATVEELTRAASSFGLADAERVKAIEATTNHDVKAVEYWLRERFAANAEVKAAAEFIHFACTSEDINNLAHARMVKAARERVLLPAVDRIIARMRALAAEHADLAMLARTHGQAATPTTLGKEMANVAMRLQRARERFAAVEMLGKLNGATGGFNAHVAAVPGLDWPAFARRFVTSLGVAYNPLTTQIEPHDALAEAFDAAARLNTILVDLDRDVWGYISLGYFRQRAKAGEVGSSTMPHKVNPIDFENSEGNLGLANAMLRHLSEKLPVSRWQRDLTDSTVLRNLGVALGHTLIAWTALGRGLGKIEPDAARMRADLEGAWEVLGEAVQTVLRAAGVPDGYELLKAYTRGRSIDARGYGEFIDTLPLDPADKDRLRRLRPADYTGLAARLAGRV